jgi:hypothetical protein
MMLVIRYPLITKNTSTPTNPPLKVLRVRVEENDGKYGEGASRRSQGNHAFVCLWILAQVNHIQPVWRQMRGSQRLAGRM